MCIALSSCNLISKSSSSDESSTSDINTYDALSSIVNARAKPERVKISKREYYEMCDLKDVSKCPFDPIKIELMALAAMLGLLVKMQFGFLEKFQNMRIQKSYMSI